MGDRPVQLCGGSVASGPLDRQGIICPGYRDKRRKETQTLFPTPRHEYNSGLTASCLPGSAGPGRAQLLLH